MIPVTCSRDVHQLLVMKALMAIQCGRTRIAFEDIAVTVEVERGWSSDVKRTAGDAGIDWDRYNDLLYWSCYRLSYVSSSDSSRMTKLFEIGLVGGAFSIGRRVTVIVSDRLSEAASAAVFDYHSVRMVT